MYRVGFGDCFLVSLPVDDRQRHLLIDCGVHARGDIKTIGKVVAQIEAETGKELAVAIATHEHQDHLSGFATYADRFRAFKVEEVWMPWTSDPMDAQATKLKRKRLAFLAHLNAQFRLAAGSPEARFALENLAPNKDAMELLQSGFGGQAKVRYLGPGETLDQPAGLTGLSARVLAPPRDVSLLGKMEPPKSEKYLGADDGRSRGLLHPFQAKWVWTPGRYHKRFRGAGVSRKDQLLLERDISAEALAFALDSAVNNTSLVLILSFRGQRLLFPGDAQWGNWSSWIHADGGNDLLGQVSFYKVAHHGSYNATPKSALGAMPAGQFAAMASTQSTPWKSIPRKPLMEALARQTKNRVVESDSIPVPKAPKGPPWKTPRGFSRGEFWADYVIHL